LNTGHILHLLQRATKGLWFYECNFIVQQTPTYFGHLCDHLQADKFKNVNIFIVFRDVPHLKSYNFGICLGLKWFNRHILLNHTADFVLSSFSFVFL